VEIGEEVVYWIWGGIRGVRGNRGWGSGVMRAMMTTISEWKSGPFFNVYLFSFRIFPLLHSFFIIFWFHARIPFGIIRLYWMNGILETSYLSHECILSLFFYLV